jgi:phage FluMu gp28-like protein
MPKGPLLLYPYQLKWVQDESRRKIADKSRRIGYSFGEGWGKVHACLKRSNLTSIVLSRGERQAKQFIEESVAPHVRAFNILADFIQAEIPQTSILKQEVSFANGSKIIALPANPDTARSYEGDVTLDEFAFHKDARKIYEAVGPSITRGYNLSIISTPNGQQGTYYELALEAGLVDGKPRTQRWSPHRCTIVEAIAQGCLDRGGHLLDAAEVRADCLDEDMWLQEYMAAFLSTSQQWISPELFEANTSDEAHLGYPEGEYKDSLFAGWDIARHKDLSVIWLNESVGDVSVTRGVIDLSNMSIPDQIREARTLMPMIQRICIDQSGMGLAIAETLAEEYSGKVEGLTFTQQVKEALAVHLKNRMQQVKCRIPDTETIRYSFRGVKKTTTATGMARFDADHDAKYGHSDHFWSCALAESAAGHPLVLGVVEYFKSGQAQKELEEMDKVLKASSLAKPMIADQAPKCPKCGDALIQTLPGNARRCQACGHQWFPAGAPDVNYGPSRGEYFDK